MCGITGMIYTDKSREIETPVLKSMTDAVNHRGPDDEGFYIKNNVGLGFRRLSIIDLNTGHQPLANENSSIFIVFNGEIYNYLEQREILKNKGYNFKSATDTEVILHLYEEYGENCIQYLRGMFAFAIWDENKQQLFCVRDRFGIKPFYYYADTEKFIFGSEIKSILKCGNIDSTMSYEALDSYFAFGYITSDLSIYKKIKKLQPAHYLLLSFKNKFSIEIKKYWEINFEPDYSKTEKQWTEELEHGLSESVKLHMMADVPLGAFLSGGIDSSSVVAMMAKHSNKPIKTFSIGFKEKKFDELEFAREVAKKFNCEHHEQIVEPESISLLPKLVSAYDEPFADPSTIPTYYVSKLAREYVTVALSGDGGDELFAGYDEYSSLKRIYSYPFNFKSPFFNKLIWGNLHRLIPEGGKGRSTSFLLSKNKEYIGAYSTVFSKNERSKLILNHCSASYDIAASESYKVEILKNAIGEDFITRQQHLDIQTYMVDDILTKVDRVSMLNSLETRVPLLDHKFAELSFRIPWSYKLRGEIKKYIFKQAVSASLPNNILKHPKQGFGVPLSLWFKNGLGEYVDDTLLSPNSLLSSYLDKNYVKAIVKNKSNIQDYGTRIWSLLFFEEWLKLRTAPAINK
jgi:asparagine synthase (glutamine-hydrolysing)